MSYNLPPFHLAIIVHELAQARDFYGEVLGCTEGRSAEHWVDFDFFGHQLVCHSGAIAVDTLLSQVDSDSVPVPHFGVVLSMNDWRKLAERLRLCNQVFVLEPKIRFAGQSGEQGTFFLYDPFGNALEFKGFADPEALFAR
ncbi:MAG: glyoxalase [Gammaproteobacteria bacterium]|nr:glyoxalase [Gammaproteobacteria bacterium]